MTDPKELERAPDLMWTWRIPCPNCNTTMVERGCKLRCPNERCGYFQDCGDAMLP